MHVHCTGLDIANGHKADAFDVEMLIYGDDKRRLSVCFQLVCNRIHESVQDGAQFYSVTFSKGPFAEPGLLEQHLRLVLIDPSAVWCVNNRHAFREV